ncbi:MAG: T9SS type A sorting domain-containing protein, partial [Flammeovirgaceae bacterium]
NEKTDKILFYNEPLVFEVTSLPTTELNSIDTAVRKMVLDFKFSIVPGDNTPKKFDGSQDDGDFDTVAYRRIDFRRNDTTRATYILDDYYAYDDGTAEYGARINGIGTQLAYEFNLKTPDPDILIAFDYYFPPFGDESSQSVQFHVLGALTGQETDYLYRRNTQIKRSTNSKFVRETLASPVTVQGKFYIGWRLLSNALILVGLDRSFDSGSKLFYNSSGDWVQNTDLRGSLMIRPVFIRKGQPPPPVAVADEVSAALYPNPNNGTFYLPVKAEQIVVIDVTGRPVATIIEDELDRKKISTTAPVGVYLVRYFDGQWRTAKMLVKP